MPGVAGPHMPMFPQAAPRPRPRAGWPVAATAAAFPTAVFETKGLRAGAVAAPPWGGAEAIGEDAEAEGGGLVVDREVVDDAADTRTTSRLARDYAGLFPLVHLPLEFLDFARSCDHLPCTRGRGGGRKIHIQGQIGPGTLDTFSPRLSTQNTLCASLKRDTAGRKSALACALVLNHLLRTRS